MPPFVRDTPDRSDVVNSLLSNFFQVDGIGARIFLVLFGAFTIWMLVDAIRREEWFWVIFIFFFPLLNAPLYFFLVYRRASPVVTRGFQLPGTRERSRIKTLEDQIHHLDKAHHHLELGDIYFQQGRLEKALASYLGAMDRDPSDLDIRAHLGQCLMRLNRAAEARPLLETVCAENPKHDYGHSMMALAEAHAELGEADTAIATWRRVLEDNAYARARVQLAELLFAKGDKAAAAIEVEEVLRDDAHAPGFQRRRDALWIKRAKLLRTAI
jgi:hypothetical protein